MAADQAFPMWMTKLISLAAALAVVAGSTVLVGWAFDIAALTSILPAWPSMKANTALSFILIGIALLASAPPHVRSSPQRQIFLSRLARLCVLLAGLLGLLTLAEYAFGWNLGIDLLLQEPSGATDTSPPGRMAPETASCFVLLALALGIDSSSQKPRWLVLASAALGLLVATLALAVILNYATPNLGAYGWFGRTSMAMHTAMSFAALGLAVMAKVWRPEVLPWSLGRNATLMFAGGAALLVAVGLVTSRSQSWVTTATHRIEQREIMMRSFYRAMGDIARVQSYTRGYLITGDERFLRGYLSATADSDRAMDALRQLIADNPDLQQDLATFEAQTHEALQWFAQVITAGQAGMSDAARREMVGHGADLMDQLDATFDRINRDDQEHDAQLQEESEQVARYAYRIIFGGMLASLAIFLAGIFRLNFSVLERRRAEEALYEREQQLRLFVEHSPAAIAMFDRDMRYLVVSHRWLSDYHLTDTEIAGRSHYDVFPDLPERWKAIHRRCLDGAIEKCDEDPFPRTDGTTDWVRWEIRPWHSAQGDIGGLIVFSELVTERKRTQDELQRHREHLQELVDEQTLGLRDSAARLQTVLDTVVDGIITIDDHGIVEAFNPAAERIFGYTSTEVIGQNVKLLMPEPHRCQHDGYLERYRATGEARVIGVGREVTGRRKDGGTFPVELAVSEMRLGEGRYFTGTVRDITARKEAERQLLAAKEQAQQASTAKSAFLAAMSHEIRTPMNGVIGMIDVLHQSSLKGYQVEMVDLIRESAYSLLGIINDILDFSKIEAGKLELKNTPMPLAEVVEKACAMLEHLAGKKRVELTLFTDPAIPAEVLGDAGRLRQVLVNLANNAIKFSDGRERAGRVSVRAVLAERGPDRVVVEFCVADNGIGMDEVTLAGLFTPFAQADVSTTRRFGGTGLGLAIAHHLVSLMGGEIAVQSVPGQGSTFTVRLPFVPLPDAGRDLSRQVGLKPDLLLAGLSCLVVGDPQGLAGDVAAYLVHGGAAIERAPDLAAARKRGGTGSPGLWVWVLDVAGTPPPLDELCAIARTRPEQEIRFVVIGRGQRRKPRRTETDVVQVDGNVLTRKTVLTAVAIAARRAQEEKEAPPPGKTEAAFNPPSRAAALRQGRLILVAEDNETNQKVILRQLALLGFAADVAGDGRQALEHWRSGDYALLLTDLHMPEMDGYNLAAAIRAEEKGSRRIPILALTANALKGEAEHCRAVGMDDYLSKPVQLAHLKAVLEKWLPAAAESGPDSEGASCPFPLRGGSAVQNGCPAVLSPDLPAMPVDVKVLKALVGDDPAVIREFLHDFRAGATQTAVELKAACEQGQAAQAGALAHRLKSSARSVGALALGELCARMEQAGKAGEIDALAALWSHFETGMAAVDKYLGSS